MKIVRSVTCRTNMVILHFAGQACHVTSYTYVSSTAFNITIVILVTFPIHCTASKTEVGIPFTIIRVLLSF
jgi:hypothetical protein